MGVRTCFPLAATAAVLAVLGAAETLPGATVGRTAVLERFAERFREEVYPLLAGGSLACAACHHNKSSQAFQVLGSSGATFSLLLERDLLEPNDPMAIPSRVSSEDPELRMPKGGTFEDAEIETDRPLR